MANVIDQTDDSELATDGQSSQSDWVKNYIDLMNSRPPLCLRTSPVPISLWRYTTASVLLMLLRTLTSEFGA
eukprot:696144-Amphidinium_carterae.1